MDALEAIRKRRSVRAYTGDPVPRADLETIVDAGRLAATGFNRQPWDFIVVTDAAIIDQLTVAGRGWRRPGPLSPWWWIPLPSTGWRMRRRLRRIC